MDVPNELLDRASALARTCERADLQRRLEQVRRRLRSRQVRVVVTGPAGHGASTLVNVLAGAPVCTVAGPLDAVVPTEVPTVVRHGAEPSAVLVPASGDAPDGHPDPDPAREPVAVPVETVARRVAQAVADGAAPLRAEVSLPRRLLAEGLELVDAPSVGGLDPAPTLRTLDLLPTASAVLVVTDASQELTAPELAFLQQAHALCPTVAVVVTRTDLGPHWRTIVERDRAHLTDAGLDCPVFPVSSVLAATARQHRDAALHAESGLPALTGWLTGEVTAAGTRRAEAVAHDLASVTAEMALALRSELAVLQDPAGLEATTGQLERARAAVEQLTKGSSRWHQVLNDGVADLNADIDHDLRDRSRVIIREAEDVVDAQDPGAVWDEVADWLDQRVAGALADSFVWASQRAEWLAGRVFEQFADDLADLPDMTIGDPDEVLVQLVELADVDRGELSLRERLFIGLRGSYTGVLMTGLVTSLAGMPLVNPLSLAAGVVLGRKAYKDDAQARRDRRAQEAKNAVRKHLDEVVFQAGKVQRERLRRVQRTLRDLLTETVQQRSEAYQEALRGAQQAVRTATGAREARLRAVRAQLDQVDRLAGEVTRRTGRAVAAR